MKAKVAKIAAHGITCFVNRQLIYNYPESLFAEHGIMSIEHADFEGVERLALVTGGEIASSFDKVDGIKIGHCDLIEEIMIGEDRVRPAHPSFQLLPVLISPLLCLRLLLSSSSSLASQLGRPAPSFSAERRRR